MLVVQPWLCHFAKSHILTIIWPRHCCWLAFFYIPGVTYYFARRFRFLIFPRDLHYLLHLYHDHSFRFVLLIFPHKSYHCNTNDLPLPHPQTQPVKAPLHCILLAPLGIAQVHSFLLWLPVHQASNLDCSNAVPLAGWSPNVSFLREILPYPTYSQLECLR